METDNVGTRRRKESHDTDEPNLLGYYMKSWGGCERCNATKMINGGCQAVYTENTGNTVLKMELWRSVAVLF